MSLKTFRDQSQSRVLPWWWIVLPWLAFVLAGFLYWLLKRRPINQIQPVKIDLSFIRPPQARPMAPASAPAQEAPAAPPAAEPAPQPFMETPPVPPDDLTVIYGIGPKVAAILQAGGVTTFHILGQADPAHLRDLLLEANLRLPDPTTWPAQAQLAAAGKWDELKVWVESQKARRGS